MDQSKKLLVDAVRKAEKRLEKAIKALAPKHVGGEMEERDAAHIALMEAQRALARNLGEPYAVNIDFPVQWDMGAPLPTLIQNDYQAILIFILDGGLTGDGTTVQVVDPMSAYKVATVQFEHCVSTKMGSPNEEVFHGHPLNGKGLDSYRAMKVENSKWIRELADINSVHGYYDPKSWQDLNHYIFGFHDCTFECVAGSFSIQVTDQSVHAAALVALNDICE